MMYGILNQYVKLFMRYIIYAYTTLGYDNIISSQEDNIFVLDMSDP